VDDEQVGSSGYVEEDQEEEGAHAARQGEPRQAPEHGSGLSHFPVLSTAPPARRDDVVDVLHGVPVPDPYRWLEDADSAETKAWVAAQNERTRRALDARPDRPQWHDRLVELLGVRVSTACRIAGDRVFTLERAGGQAQFALVVRSAVDPSDVSRVVLDPSSGAADAAVAIDWYHPSRDGRLVAYGISEGGDERSTLRVLDVDTGTLLSDTIPDTRAASVGWLSDVSGFLYTRYPAGDEYHRMVYAHTLGADWHDDPLVWGELPTPESWPDVHLSPDGRWALVHVLVGWGRTDVHLLDRDNGAWRTVVAERDALTHLTFDGDRLVGTTTLDAPRGRVVAAGLDDPAVEHWSTLVPEGDGVLDACLPAGGTLLVASTRHAIALLHRYDADGTPAGEIALPELGSFSGLHAEPDRPLAFAQLESFTRPASLWRWTPEDGLVSWGGTAPRAGSVAAVAGDGGARGHGDHAGARADAGDGAGARADGARADAGDSAGARADAGDAARAGAGDDSHRRPHADGDRALLPIDPDAFAVRQVRYSSLDGTDIGLFLVHRRGLTPDPDMPCILTGYGGFAIAETPAWSPAVAAWCELGGLYAIAGLHGGYEEGEAWHRAGRREQKQHVFDDFAAAADFLVAAGWTSRDRLALRGGSNGGLLVGAALTQRPDLARAVHCAVPLLDMIRFPQFLIARLWTDEYGDPDVAEEFEWLRAYSPYHHVVEGSCYPAVLFTAAEGDSRVDALHARKMAAALQWATTCGEARPILLRQEGRAGHGVGKPLQKQADELADVLTFLSWQLDDGRARSR
jgi:prolyl oligopeptidase